MNPACLEASADEQVVLVDEDARQTQYSIREAMKGRSGACPACDGASVHEPGCSLLAAKRRGFALVLGVPLLLLLLLMASVGDSETIGSVVGGLVAGAVGCAVTGLWYRRRLARQRRQ